MSLSTLNHENYIQLLAASKLAVLLIAALHTVSVVIRTGSSVCINTIYLFQQLFDFPYLQYTTIIAPNLISFVNVHTVLHCQQTFPYHALRLITPQSPHFYDELRLRRNVPGFLLTSESCRLQKGVALFVLDSVPPQMIPRQQPCDTRLDSEK